MKTEFNKQKQKLKLLGYSGAAAFENSKWAYYKLMQFVLNKTWVGGTPEVIANTVGNFPNEEESKETEEWMK